YTLERALRRGAREALVVACGCGQCRYREGVQWLGPRPDGGRKALRRGPRGAPRGACGGGQGRYREGVQGLRQRLGGERKPMLREPEAHRRRIHVLELDRTRKRDLLRMAEALRLRGALTEPRV